MSSFDFKEIKNKILPGWFMENVIGVAPRMLGGSLRYAACPSCGASSDSSVKVSVRGAKWHCFSCLKSGDVLDAARNYWGLPHLDAAKRLSEFSPSDIESHKAKFIKSPKTAVRDTAAICDVIAKLQAAQTELHDEVRKYLLKRGIRKATAKEAMEKGLLLSLPADPILATKYLLQHVGKPLLVKAGMWKEGAKLPTIAYRPLGFVSVGAESVEFRVIEKSENNFAKALRYGPSALWILSGDKDTYMITEGCIDMLSAREFKIERTLVALPGAKNWQPEWLEMFRNKAVLIALDTDETGKSAQKELIKKLEEVNATVVEYPIPPEVKDLNDWLLYDNLTSKI